jgi:transcription-repair coupling factor (superfamily II helicase)
MPHDKIANVLAPPSLGKPGTRTCWRGLSGSALALALERLAATRSSPLLVIAADSAHAQRLALDIAVFADATDLPVLTLPEWETLPYDIFSPHQDIVSERLATLYRMPNVTRGVVIVPIATLLQRLCPREYLDNSALMVDVGERINLDAMRKRFENAGYLCVPEVLGHGEFAVRGSILDIYPMGATQAYRIDLFDDEVESIRSFDPETQRSLEKIARIELLPAREFPMTDEGIAQFRREFRARFSGEPQASSIYRDVSNKLAPSGIEYYLPLFFTQTATLFDYLPPNTLALAAQPLEPSVQAYAEELQQRYEQRRHDRDRPILPPEQLYLTRVDLQAQLRKYEWIEINALDSVESIHFNTLEPPRFHYDQRQTDPVEKMLDYVRQFDGRIYLVAETAGRREALAEKLKSNNITFSSLPHWQAFWQAQDRVVLGVGALEQGLIIKDPSLCIITEGQLYGERAQQRRRRQKQRDSEFVIRDLTDLHIGAPVVHEEHGVGRYLGLQILTVGGMETELLTLEYADGAKLYVPVANLQVISRYSGAAPENAPLHRLGTDQWAKARKKAAEKVRDVAAELLDLYAKRAARQGHVFDVEERDYQAFAAAFPFEETPDQLDAINAVLADMRSGRPMDRVVCGDVGFGKTEVAMRAAFVGVQGGRQVAVLVPTTLLAQQHYENFRDRMAEWPIRIEMLSRFKTAKEQRAILDTLAEGKIDIIIGTHKLFQEDIQFKKLGLVVVDEEHRFGVRHKESLKKIRAEVDVLTLTATPIPRTLNMAMAGLRELSVIATPPAKRLAVKTFVTEYNSTTIKEAILREIKRGGQVYYLHNAVDTIERTAQEISKLIPEARVQFAHGQMLERELERVMLDFYHHRFNVLIATTIIESGIDVPSANTIVIDRADKLGLAQLHQLRGRVGRSHHQAYAYLLIPSRKSLTQDACKRLEAIESLEELGAGFMLATHDLEIRGAGELLGDEQSGQMQEVGFTLYTELLERAVKALKNGEHLNLDSPMDHGAEIDVRIPALLPADYLPDVHTRLVLYKRIASAAQPNDLRELQVEMIDRFGLLPPQAKLLFRLTELKQRASALGIRKIDGESAGLRLTFKEKTPVDPIKIIKLIQQSPRIYKLDGPNRLKVIQDMPEPEKRLDTIEHVLNAIH